MNTTAYLDQRAAAIRANREGLPYAGGPKKAAEMLAASFPELPREKLGAVLLMFGALLSDAWTQFEQMGEPPEEILPLLCCLTNTAGEYLYAPEGSAS